jgi:hypothetical protein
VSVQHSFHFAPGNKKECLRVYERFGFLREGAKGACQTLIERHPVPLRYGHRNRVMMQDTNESEVVVVFLPAQSDGRSNL